MQVPGRLPRIEFLLHLDGCLRELTEGLKRIGLVLPMAREQKGPMHGGFGVCRDQFPT
jgi:hypothetical protein